ncbi:protein ANTAGONIST OF LIKE HETEROCHROMATIN PROTEIN 1-like isoform X1 [Rhagoletis pomonella]|uniref:protein ANTAGONIST OF LIKE HETEROCHROMATIN PROTEIN 1-like isoform X1 n=1 Tax=Rhagoletis pomonella TaxID=28610 RepID=UPI001785B2FF|nr:protein ANTAGONIST OF LIKE HETEROCHROMATIN PROTEIN 1-like isoform X1 [Rhagoletis pomonella]XP_036327842.1 protein ANTAGONIST OF LIKE HETEROCHROMATIN PROTEIN 1-like isoform X1 [Rhagoletis pomonella]XP_036327845.1 protein ANTAGONIST OF LIKE HETEROCHROMATIN PROTEIN 1-like isoform X1 [Rhagoletis pomonella]XP_036327846.1 protein ANTAGONIST OF LIKE HETEROCHROMATIN PROTEIN 1-like isoform X1 [Rhagoletis pomonella]XP_036327847.1 protein ANTAGONIST OF LIKE HETEROCHROMATIN PROTEIN 1-like isoform X1 [Rh
MSLNRQILSIGVNLVSQALVKVLLAMLKDKLKVKKRKMWVRKWIRRRAELGASDNLYRELASEDVNYFKQCLRMNPAQFEDLLAKVAPLIEKQDTIMREALTPRIKLQIALKFLATGDNYLSLSESFRVPRSTISELLKEVLDSIYAVLQEYIQVPKTTEQWLEVQKDFNDKWQFPFCCGAIDGKHVVIDNPPHGASDYYNYKGTYSVVLFAIVDAHYRFLYIDVGTNGRMNDASILKKSRFYKELQEDELGLPTKGVFVGDDAFPLTTRILKPYSRHDALPHKEKIFNYRLSRARRIVENAFGIMACRFRVFRKPISVSLDKTDSIIKTACALHNWLRTSNLNETGLVDQEDINTGAVQQGSWRSIPSGGLQELTTQLSSNNYSRSAKELRDKFANYFVGSGAVPWQDKMVC